MRFLWLFLGFYSLSSHALLSCADYMGNQDILTVAERMGFKTQKAHITKMDTFYNLALSACTYNEYKKIMGIHAIEENGFYTDKKKAFLKSIANMGLGNFSKELYAFFYKQICEKAKFNDYVCLSTLFQHFLLLDPELKLEERWLNLLPMTNFLFKGNKECTHLIVLGRVIRGDPRFISQDLKTKERRAHALIKTDNPNTNIPLSEVHLEPVKDRRYENAGYLFHLNLQIPTTKN